MKVFVLILTILISKTCFSQVLDFRLIKEFVLEKTNTYYLIKVKQLDDDTLIKLKSNKNLISIVKGFGGRGSYTFLVIKPDKPRKKYQIYSQLSKKKGIDYKVQVFIKEILEPSIIYTYKKLYISSQLWFENNDESYLKIDNIFVNLLDSNINDNLKHEALSYYLSFLLKRNKFQKIHKVLIGFSFDKVLSWKTKSFLIWFKSLSLLNLGEIDKSKKLLDNLINFLDQKKILDLSWQLNLEEIRVYLGLIKSISSLKNHMLIDDGLKELKASLYRLKELGDNELISLAFTYLGSYYMNRGEYYNSIANLEMAEKYYKISGLSSTLILLGILNEKGLAYKKANLLVKSQTSFRKALELLNNETDQLAKFSLYYNLGLTYEALGDYKRANRYYLYIKKFDGNQFYKSLAIKSQGRVFRLMGKLNESLIVHQNNIKVFENNSFNLMVESIAELSRDYLDKGELSNSINHALTALILNNLDVYDEYDLETTYQQLIKELSIKVEPNLNSLISRFLSIKFKKLNYAEILSLQVLVSAHIKTSNIKFVNKLFDILFSVGVFQNISIYQKLEIYQLKINFLANLKKFDELNNISKTAIKLINETRIKFDVSDLALYWSNKAKSILNNYIDALIVQNKYQQIFELLEKYYAINLREKRHSTTDEIIKEKSKGIQKALDDYVKLERETLLSNDKGKQNLADEAKEHFLALNMIETKSHKNIELKYLSIEQVQDNLFEKELFVRYYLNDNNAIAFIIDKHSWKVLELPENTVLKENVKTVLNNIKSKSFRKLQANDALLSDILPLDLISSQKYEKLIIIPDGILNLLPFGSINISPNEGQYQPLASNLTIERAYSASDYFASIELPQKNTHSISVFANPIFLNQASDKIKIQFNKDNRLWEFSALPNTKTDAEDIISIFPDYDINLLTGNKATNENFMSAENRNANIIHIATHGFFNEANMEDVGVATSIVNESNQLSAGVLAMREVLYKPFTSNLVVISGCETTLGKEINGEGFNSLSRGFLSQGVGSVIGTIWSISDRATPEFMQIFYKNLKREQGNVPLALKLTKQSFITDSRLRRYRHPYYWAGFVLTSSNRTISENIFQ